MDFQDWLKEEVPQHQISVTKDWSQLTPLVFEVPSPPTNCYETGYESSPANSCGQEFTMSPVSLDIGSDIWGFQVQEPASCPSLNELTPTFVDQQQLQDNSCDFGWDENSFPNISQIKLINSDFSPVSRNTFSVITESNVKLESRETSVTMTNSKANHQLSDDNLISLPISQLNKLMKNIPQDTVAKLKQRRRTLKNRQYAQECRKRKVINSSCSHYINLQDLHDRINRLEENVCSLRNDRDFYKNLYQISTKKRD